MTLVPPTTVAQLKFTATLDPGTTPEQLKQEIAIKLGVPIADVDVTEDGTSPTGNKNVVINFKGSDAATISQRFNDPTNQAGLGIEPGSIQASAANDTGNAPSTSNVPIIAGAVAGAIVLFAIIVGIVVKMSGKSHVHEDFEPHQNTQYTEELVGRNPETV